MGLFDFIFMADNYDERAVARYEEGDVFVDTCRVYDSAQPYETAVGHPEYNNGNLIIVQLYDTKEEAQIGHDFWVKNMTTEPLPDIIKDVSTAIIMELVDAFSDNDDHRYFERNSDNYESEGNE